MEVVRNLTGSTQRQKRRGRPARKAKLQRDKNSEQFQRVEKEPSQKESVDEEAEEEVAYSEEEEDPESYRPGLGYDEQKVQPAESQLQALLTQLLGSREEKTKKPE